MKNEILDELSGEIVIEKDRQKDPSNNELGWTKDYHEGFIHGIERSIELVEEKDDDDLKNLYYLDELIKDMHNFHVINYGTKYMEFIVDWYSELYEKVGHTDKEREEFLIGHMGEEWYEEGNFLTTEERDLLFKKEL